ncbi:MAG: hypothetical protein V3V04_05330 [Rhizobiaceae bacterium]
MSSDNTFYKFKVEGFTLESMPFGRLIEYYAELATMIGQEDNMHLVDVEESSHANLFKIAPNYESAITTRISAIQDKTAPRLALVAHDKINQMLADDNTSGEFTDHLGRNIILFPGVRHDTPKLVSMRDTATFIGELYQIAGTNKDAKIRIKTELYGVVYCTTTKDIAKALSDYLFEQIKVSGQGMWTKNANGGWDIGDFTITDFLPVQKESLRGTVDRLRDLKLNWPKDSLAKLKHLDEKSG